MWEDVSMQGMNPREILPRAHVCFQPVLHGSFFRSTSWQHLCLHQPEVSRMRCSGNFLPVRIAHCPHSLFLPLEIVFWDPVLGSHRYQSPCPSLKPAYAQQGLTAVSRIPFRYWIKQLLRRTELHLHFYSLFLLRDGARIRKSRCAIFKGHKSDWRNQAIMFQDIWMFY